MGAITASVIAIVAVALGWITIEIACKPCLEKGREAIDRSLNPDYDPDDDDAVRVPLNPNPKPNPYPGPTPTPDFEDPKAASSTSSAPDAIKTV